MLPTGATGLARLAAVAALDDLFLPDRMLQAEVVGTQGGRALLRFADGQTLDVATRTPLTPGTRVVLQVGQPPAEGAPLELKLVRVLGPGDPLPTVPGETPPTAAEARAVPAAAVPIAAPEAAATRPAPAQPQVPPPGEPQPQPAQPHQATEPGVFRTAAGTGTYRPAAGAPLPSPPQSTPVSAPSPSVAPGQPTPAPAPAPGQQAPPASVLAAGSESDSPGAAPAAPGAPGVPPQQAPGAAAHAQPHLPVAVVVPESIEPVPQLLKAAAPQGTAAAQVTAHSPTPTVTTGAPTAGLPAIWLPIPLPGGRQAWVQIVNTEEDGPRRPRGAKAGAPSVRIFWESGELGPVTANLELAGGRDARLRAQFAAGGSEALQELQAALPELSAALACAGFPGADLQVHLSPEPPAPLPGSAGGRLDWKA